MLKKQKKAEKSNKTEEGEGEEEHFQVRCMRHRVEQCDACLEMLLLPLRDCCDACVLLGRSDPPHHGIIAMLPKLP